MWQTKAFSFLMRSHPRQYVGAKAYRKDWEEFLAFLRGL